MINQFSQKTPVFKSKYKMGGLPKRLQDRVFGGAKFNPAIICFLIL